MPANNFNPLMPVLKLHSNGPLYCNTEIGTLAVDGWAVTFGTARRGLGKLGPRPVPSSQQTDRHWQPTNTYLDPLWQPGNKSASILVTF